MSLEGVVGMSGNGHKSKGHGSHKGHGSPLEIYMRQRTHAKKLADTIELHHEEAYTTAVKSHVVGEDGLVDYKRLNDSGVQAEVAEAMGDFYVQKAADYFKKDVKDLDQMQKDMLMKAYTGTTRGELKNYVTSLGEDFTLERFAQVKRQFRDRVEGELAQSAASHIKQTDLEGIVKGMGAAEKLDASKLDVPEATRLLERYHRNDGVLAEKDYAASIAKKAAHAGAGHH